MAQCIARSHTQHAGTILVEADRLSAVVRTPNCWAYLYPESCFRLTRRSPVARLLVVLVAKACGLPLPPQQALPVPPAAFAGRSGRRWCFRSRRSLCLKKHREEVGADTSYPRAFHEKVNKFWGRHLPGAFYLRVIFRAIHLIGSIWY